MVTGTLEAAASGALLLHGPDWSLFLVTTMLGVALGTQAAAARRVGVRDVTTVVVTSTITALSADALRHGHGDAGRRVTVVALMLAGAAFGAATLRWGPTPGLLVASVVSLAVGGLGLLRPAVRGDR